MIFNNEKQQPKNNQINLISVSELVLNLYHTLFEHFVKQMVQMRAEQVKRFRRWAPVCSVASQLQNFLEFWS